MRKAMILAMTMIVSVIALAQEDQPVRDYTVLKGLSFGVGVPIECLDLPDRRRWSVERVQALQRCGQ